MLRFMVAYHSPKRDRRRRSRTTSRDRSRTVARWRGLIQTDDLDDISMVGGFDAAIIARCFAYGRLWIGTRGIRLEAFRRTQQGPFGLSLGLAVGRLRAIHWIWSARREKRWSFRRRPAGAPSITQYVAGAVRDRQTGFLKRLIIHTIMRLKGVELDPSGTTEFTDWKALDRFVTGFVAEVAATRADARL